MPPAWRAGTSAGARSSSTARPSAATAIRGQSLREIAKAHQVSRATVSRVLRHRQPGASDATMGAVQFLAVASGVDGYPASVVAFTRALVSVLASSKVTTACFFSYLTSTLETPCTLLSAFLTVMGQVGQVIPGTFRVTVFVAAQTDVDIAAMNTSDVKRRIILFIKPLLIESVKVFRQIRVHQGHQRQCDTSPQQDLVKTACLRQSANLARPAGLHRAIDIPPRKEQRHEGDDNENWTVGLKPRQISDPSAADTYGDQN